jgi:ribosome-associated heat shock protein Hsp15
VSSGSCQFGTRRGPATEAQALYDDLDPPRKPTRRTRPRVGPRPTKKARRNMDDLRDPDV